MQGGLKNVYDSIKAFSETDFHEDLKKIDVPTLVMHGEDDQIVPIGISGRKSAKLIKGAKEIFYPGLPHGLTATNADQVNADLLEFLKSVQRARRASACMLYAEPIGLESFHLRAPSRSCPRRRSHPLRCS